MLFAFGSDKLKNRSGFILAGLCVAICGNVILYLVHGRREVEFAGLALYTMGVIAVCPILVCWFSMNLKGHLQRSVAPAWQIGFGNIAGVIAPFAYPSKDAPRYHLGYSLGLGCLCLSVAASTAYFIGCVMENRRRPKGHKLLL